MTNLDLAGYFREMAALLELQGLTGFKLRAYQRAAEAIESHPEALAALAREGRLREVRGIGSSFAAKIEELLATGTCGLLEQLRADYPPGVLDLMRVPGVGPKTAAALGKQLGVSDLAGLEEAAGDGRLATLPGMGPKRVAAVLAGIQSVRSWGGRTPIAQAKPIADALVAELAGYPEVRRAEAVGSLRRGRETIGDLDILVETDRGSQALARLAESPAVIEVLALGQTKASVRMRSIAQVDVRAVVAESYGAALVYFTGSKEHNVRLRELAKAAGMRLNEYGIYKDDGVTPAGPTRTEREVYAALGMAFVPPELREDRGEIEAALRDQLPQLLEAPDIRGDLHAHTSWTDGQDELEAMAAAATSLGREYLAITDHSRALAFVGGLGPDRLREQGELIRAYNRVNPDGVRLLWGCEVEILADGSLDLPEDLLAELEWVVAAVHNPKARAGADLTTRICRAAANPLVDVIAHPTGQLIGVRESYSVDARQLFEAALQSRVALEINASPHRLDLPPELAREAANLGIELVISTDAHDARSLAELSYGVTAARRAWLRAADVLNTLSLQALMEWRESRRADAGKPG